ncbi:hypothetical protein FRB98_006182 [Tulasnella sp. 332]|nr:hypothetical protein FRB98_006182 [Tulasnella sp. 332]
MIYLDIQSVDADAANILLKILNILNCSSYVVKCDTDPRLAVSRAMPPFRSPLESVENPSVTSSTVVREDSYNVGRRTFLFEIALAMEELKTPLCTRRGLSLELNSSLTTAVHQMVELLDPLRMGEDGYFILYIVPWTGESILSEEDVARSLYRLPVVTELKLWDCTGVESRKSATLKKSAETGCNAWLFPKITSLTIHECPLLDAELMVKVVKGCAAASSERVGADVIISLQNTSIKGNSAMNSATPSAIREVVDRGAHWERSNDSNADETERTGVDSEETSRNSSISDIHDDLPDELLIQVFLDYLPRACIKDMVQVIKGCAELWRLVAPRMTDPSGEPLLNTLDPIR